MSKRLMSLFTVVMMLAVFSSAQALAVTTSTPSPTVGQMPTTQIIMKDGNVCNPLRWGC
jgi:hypothetical protein